MQDYNDLYYIPDEYRHHPFTLPGARYVRLIAPPGYGKTWWLKRQKERTGWHYLDLKKKINGANSPRDFLREIQDLLAPGSTGLLLDHPPAYEVRWRDYFYALDDFLWEHEEVRVMVGVRDVREDPLTLGSATEIRLGAWTSKGARKYFQQVEAAPDKYQSFIGADTEHHIPEVVALFADNPDDLDVRLRRYLLRVFSVRGEAQEAWLPMLAALTCAPSPANEELQITIYQSVQKTKNIEALEFAKAQALVENNRIRLYTRAEDYTLRPVWEPALRPLLQAWLRRFHPDVWENVKTQVDQQEKKV